MTLTGVSGADSGLYVDSGSSIVAVNNPGRLLSKLKQTLDADGT